MQWTYDDTWHRAALAGNEDAVAALAHGALQPLYRFCLYRLGGNRHLCEEVVQETLVRAIRELARYEPDRAGGSIFPWLTGLARNEIRRALSQEPATASLEAVWARVDEQLREAFARLESRPLGDEALRREETRQVVNATMSQLPPPYREALEAKYVAGRSVREMAAASRKSEKAVESQLSRARKAFRAAFMALSESLRVEAIT